MAHMSIFPGNREIVEIEEDGLHDGENYRVNNFTKSDTRRDEKDRSLIPNDGNVSALEEDLNQLFEIFNRKASSHGASHQSKPGSSKRNTSKKPVKAARSHTSGHGISERMNLKQALRGLCLSQASEMAAMKRSTKSPRSSEAGRIMTMYRNVVVEDVIPGHSRDDSREGMLEISLVPERASFDSFQSIPGKSPLSDLWPSNQNSLADKANEPITMLDDRFAESNGFSDQISKPEKPSCVASSSFSKADHNVSDMGHSILSQNQVITKSTTIGNQTSASDMLQKQKLKQKQILSPPSSSPSAKTSVTKSRTRDSGKACAAVDCANQTSFTELSPTRKHASPISSSSGNYARMSPAQKDSVILVASVTEAGTHKSMVGMLLPEENAYAQSCSGDFHDKAWEHNNKNTTDDEKFSSSALRSEKNDPQCSSGISCGKTSLDIASKMAEQQEIILMSPVARNQKKNVMAQKEEHTPARSPRRSDLGDNVLHHSKNSASPSYKLLSKETAAVSPKVVTKDKLKTVTSTDSPNGKKVSRSTKNAQHLVKPLIKTKNFVKRKTKKKMAADNGSKNIHSEFNNGLFSSPSPIVCPRCQCDVTDAWKEANEGSSFSYQDSPVSPQESLVSVEESPTFYQDSPISPFANLSDEVGLGNVVSDFSTPGPSSDGINKSKTIVVESSSNSKSRDKTEFTQSSKSSPDECSSSNSVSEESNVSRPSFCDRPHMSKDVRWEAIRHVRFQHGTLGLRNFSLLKKLGCGDIGTVYLAELIGTNCLFAIKVMDCEFLARRKKITRAQTEKEILRMLDHPFLPTLYCQFTSDNLSCLVMEYCPGGDLHVLRQRQSGRCFTEQAARFYVAEVLLALEYLHMLGVIYRDLKPENILVREDGHIMLSDFDLSLRCAVNPTLLISSSMSEGSRKISRDSRRRADSRCARPLCVEPSCQVSCFTPKLLSSSSKLRKMKSDVAAEMRPLLQLVAEPTAARSNSFVGTHEYLAPEIIKGEGHGSAVDWWTFGIFLYELLYGSTPFKGSGNEETLANVVLQNLKFPDSPLVSLQARELINALLVKDPENRLGTERGAAEIKQHPFFDGLNWALIRCAVPPELPESRGYGIPKPVSNEKNNNYAEHNSGSGSATAEHLEFDVF
ncbi:hypothetical protein RND81_11G189000 [Saponaria officinalis]|uniref:non-specific serine/threonine protein kinase n=1 Tax=Saponaria officinalis TaxID=3572 RepID=A0AAW1HNR4_SAPOF